MKVAITGGLACGKSTVCKIFQNLGACVVSSDKIVHELLSPKTNLSKKIVNALGPEVLDGNQLSRKKIADLVFQNKNLILTLENLLHPPVKEKIEELYKEHLKENPGGLFVVEVPLLFESQTPFDFEKVIVVACDKNRALERYLLKKDTDEKDFERRSKRQHPIEDKIKRADHVIYNNGSLEDLEKEVSKVFKTLTYKD